jgi:hypothetical protein
VERLGLIFKKEGGDKKDERSKFIKMDVYTQYCDITLKWKVYAMRI